MAKRRVLKERLTTGSLRPDGKPDPNLWSNALRYFGDDSQLLQDFWDFTAARTLYPGVFVFDTLPAINHPGIGDGQRVLANGTFYRKKSNPHDHFATAVSGSGRFSLNTNSFLGTSRGTLHFPVVGDFEITPDNLNLAFGIETQGTTKTVRAMVPFSVYHAIVGGSLTLGTSPVIAQVTDGTDTVNMELILSSEFTEGGNNFLVFSKEFTSSNSDLTNLETLLAAGDTYRYALHGASLNNDGTIPPNRELWDYPGFLWERLESSFVEDNQAQVLELKTQVIGLTGLVNYLYSIVTHQRNSNNEGSTMPFTSLGNFEDTDASVDAYIQTHSLLTTPVSFSPIINPFQVRTDNTGPHHELHAVGLHKYSRLVQKIQAGSAHGISLRITGKLRLFLKKELPFSIAANSGGILEDKCDLVVLKPNGTINTIGTLFDLFTPIKFWLESLRNNIALFGEETAHQHFDRAHPFDRIIGTLDPCAEVNDQNQPDFDATTCIRVQPDDSMASVRFDTIPTMATGDLVDLRFFFNNFNGFAAEEINMIDFQIEVIPKTS